MTVTVEATFENGQLRLKEPVVFVEGTALRVAITPLSGDQDPLEAVIGIGDGPSDGADNHDKYVYGKTGT